MIKSIEVARMLADIRRKPSDACLHVTRRLGEAGLIRRGSRGRSAQQVDAREVAVITIAVMAMTDGTTPTTQ